MTVRSEQRNGSTGRDQAVAAAAQLLLLALLWNSAGLSPVGWLAGIAYAAGLWAILDTALRRSRTRSLGPADRVTLARATLVGGVTALVAAGAGQGVPLTCLATVALVLDAVDGRVARRTGTVSSLGARFDMEVDAFLILVLSLRLATSLGAWVLAIGAMRYAFVAVARVMPWLRSALPPSFARKTVAAVQGIILVVACSEVCPGPVAALITASALASLVWSFGRDIGWLWQNTAPARRPRPVSRRVAGGSATAPRRRSAVPLSVSYAAPGPVGTQPD